jgi:hypothetical protein
MKAFIEVVSVSLGCLIFLGTVGWSVDWLDRRARRSRPDKWHPDRSVYKEPDKPVPFWLGDPPDGDEFP